MTTTIRRYSLNFLILALVFTSTKALYESMLEASPVGTPSGDSAAPTQRLMEKLNELDEQHIMKEKIISELKSLLMPGGYGALDFGSDEVVARLYLIATVHPEFLADVLSYHKSAISQSYLECLQTLESRIRLNLDYLEAAGEEVGVEKTVDHLRKAFFDVFVMFRRSSEGLQQLLFVSSLQQHALQGVAWKETYYGKIESKLAVQRQELEKAFESTGGADFESSFATMIILNWPAWSSTLTCGKTRPSLEPSAPQPEQTPSFTPTSPRVVPNTEPNGNVSSPLVEPQPREKKVPTPNAPKKPQRKVPSQEWIQIR